MPFSVIKARRGSGFWVVNSNTGRVLGKHETEAEAKKQLAAIHAGQAHGT